VHILWATNSVADSMDLGLSFSHCCLPNREITRKSHKIWPYSNSRSSKVIDLGVNRKLVYDFLLVTNSNFGHYRYIVYRCRDIDA